MGVVELFPLPPDDELVVEGVLFGEVLVILYFLFRAPDDPPLLLLLLLQPLLFFKVELSGVDRCWGDIIPPIPESSNMDFSDARGDARGIRWGCNGTDNGDANVFWFDVDTKVESSVPNP